jgi:uncharacterized membrane protein (UPF0127 family)
MPIVNRRSKKTLSKGYKVLRSPLSKAIGAMFRFRLDEALLFEFPSERYIPIHMLFVFCRLDCVWLDSQKKVVWIEEGVRPFRLLVRPESNAQYLIEMKAGSIKRSKTRIGDRISV